MFAFVVNWELVPPPLDELLSTVDEEGVATPLDMAAVLRTLPLPPPPPPNPDMPPPLPALPPPDPPNMLDEEVPADPTPLSLNVEPAPIFWALPTVSDSFSGDDGPSLDPVSYVIGLYGGISFTLPPFF